MQLNKNNKENGFTLIEFAVVLTISALVIAMGFSAVKNAKTNLAKTTTDKTMELIHDALSAYVVRNNRLPCPALPIENQGTFAEFGWEFGSNFGLNVGSCSESGDWSGTDGRLEGIIPFRTLELQKDEIKDGWGNYITYRVSPAFTADPEDDPVTPSIPIHGLCRTADWIEAGRNMNILKARFCCTGADRNGSTEAEINLCKEASNACNNGRRIFPFDRDNGGGARYRSGFDTDTSGPAEVYIPNAGDNIKTIVYYLLSHGENEYGAFGHDGVRDVSEGADAGTYEIRNADFDEPRVWVLEQNDVKGAGHYDDIVSWATQDEVYARMGRETCLLP